MANFNDLPLEPTPQLTDAVFTARGTAAGAERQATIADILALASPGGGNVSNSGTPTSGQAAEWVSATAVQGVAVTGTGSYVKATSPTLTTPALGTPSALVLTNATGLPVAGGGTGRATGTTAYALVATGTTATGAQQSLAAGATTEILVGGGASALPVWTTATGSGSPVRGTSPTIASPTLSGTVAGTYTIGGTPTLSVTVAGTPTWSGVNTFNNNMVIAKSSLIGSGITMVGNVNYTAAPAAADQPFGWVSTLTFNGSATPSGAEHGVASTGVFADTSLNRHAGIGIEGKVNATGLATTYTGMAGDVGFIGSAFSGTLYGFAATRMSITTDGTTPLAQGTAVGLYIPPFVGGATKYGIFSHESIRVHNTVTAYSTAGSGGTYLAHNGTDGDFGTLSGSMYFTAAAGAGAILLWGAVVAPIVDATPLGANTNRWLGAFSSGTYWGLAASVTPANNSDMMVQLTSNTSLTFKVKGTDGTVRSVSLVLV